MTIDYRATREEENYRRLFEEAKGTLSGAARTVLAEAEGEAYKFNLLHNYAYQPEEYDVAMARMRRAAAKLNDRDHKLLAKLWRAALAAAASIDPDDYETPVGHRVYAGDLHRYYRMASGLIEEILEEKKVMDVKVDPEDFSGIPF